MTAQEAEERNALAATRADWVVTSLRQAVEQVVNAAKEVASADLEDEIRAPVVAPQCQRRVIQSWNFPLYSINSSVPNPGMKNPPLPIISDGPRRRLVEVARTKSKPSQNAPAGTSAIATNQPDPPAALGRFRG